MFSFIHSVTTTVDQGPIQEYITGGGGGGAVNYRVRQRGVGLQNGGGGGGGGAPWSAKRENYSKSSTVWVGSLYKKKIIRLRHPKIDATQAAM